MPTKPKRARTPKPAAPTPEPTPTPTARAPAYEPVEFFQGSFGFGSWHWRVTHPNGNILAVGSEGYSSEAKARQGFLATQKLMAVIKLP